MTLFPHLFPMKWWDQMPWSSFSECWALRLSQIFFILKGFPGGSVTKESACQCRRCGFNPWVGKIPWRRKWQSTPVFLSGKFHGQRSLAGYSPWGCKESVVKNLLANAGDAGDMVSIPGLGRFPEEGNGNPLQYSCLENSMNRGAWKAVVHGVAKSQTRLID